MPQIKYRPICRDPDPRRSAAWSSSATRTGSPRGWTWEVPNWPRAKEFYGGLFGWNCPEGPPEAGGYSVCELAGKTVAGLGPQMNPAVPPNWCTYVNVDSADDTVAKVEANGGHRLHAADGRHGGRADGHLRATRLAPSSACGSRASTSGPSWPTSPVPTVGASSSPPTSKRSKAFYGAVFGWDSETQDGRCRCPTPSGSSVGRPSAA